MNELAQFFVLGFVVGIIGLVVAGLPPFHMLPPFHKRKRRA